MRNFAKLDTAPLNSPPSLFSVPCHPQTVKHHNENPLSCHPFPPKLLPTCENIGLQSRLRKNRTSDPSAPQILTGAPQTLPQPRPRHFPRRTLPTPKSHVIPPGPHSSTARKPRNINDLISKVKTVERELHAKLVRRREISSGSLASCRDMLTSCIKRTSTRRTDTCMHKRTRPQPTHLHTPI